MYCCLFLGRLGLCKSIGMELEWGSMILLPLSFLLLTNNILGVILIFLCFLFLQRTFQSHRGAFLKICPMKCVNLKKQKTEIPWSD